MNSLHVLPGDGLLGRTETVIWWVQHGEPLPAELLNFEQDGFLKLAAHILEHDFDVPSLAVVDLVHSAVFVFGEAVVSTEDMVLDGSTSSTWIERSLASPHHIAINPAGSVDGVTDLVAGVVRGGGAVLGQPLIAPSPYVDTTIVVEASAPSPVEVGASDEPKVATVSFDDGRVIQVRRGVIVGRNPAQNGLPVGFTSVTVLGEYVSRRHWELDLSDSYPLLRDLGSSSGTTLEVEGDARKLARNQEVPVDGDFRVGFADHWATIEVESA